jgi:preprotein translocase subunit SecA
VRRADVSILDFLSSENRLFKKFKATVQKINGLESDMHLKSNDEIRALTSRFREQAEKGAGLDSLLPEAFAAVREAAIRTLDMRLYDVQLVGALALSSGYIAEMLNGEGKTLAAVPAAYLNALPGHGVHIATYNAYLAQRDAAWMEPVYRFLGTQVGLISPGMKREEKQSAYAADVTYGINTEFIFDYLRDNMVTRIADRSQRGHTFAIVDEVDSVLIDRARQPHLIVFGSSLDRDEIDRCNEVALELQKDVDFGVNEAKRFVFLTETGMRKAARLLGVEEIDDDDDTYSRLRVALKAHYLYARDKDYVVVENQVRGIDEFTGRLRSERWGDGLHQALEAKEHIPIQEQSEGASAKITVQNYFRLYKKLSGMSGTARLGEEEFEGVYGLSVVVIPPNRDIIRNDYRDLVYRTADAKYAAAIEMAVDYHRSGRPVLIGTISIANSERVSKLLIERGIPHSVLNAKHEAREAKIIAQAGRLGAVTVATNLAGRGTDILLGGNPQLLAHQILRESPLEEGGGQMDYATAYAKAKEICRAKKEKVVAAGGLAIIGTERHESRRVDNQLRGRSGRQGDPGTSQYFLSLEDDLMRLFGGDRMHRISVLMQRTDMPDDMPIDSGMVTGAIENAQKQVELLHYEQRKELIEYDDILDEQRLFFYAERNKVFEEKHISDLSRIIDETIPDLVKQALEKHRRESDDAWDTNGLMRWGENLTRGEFPASLLSDCHNRGEVQTAIEGHLKALYASKRESLGEKDFASRGASIMLNCMDTRWRRYLSYLDDLQTGIRNRPFYQDGPLATFRNESVSAFQQMFTDITHDFAAAVLQIHIAPPETPSDC